MKRNAADAILVKPFVLIAVLVAFAAGCGETKPEREAAAPKAEATVEEQSGEEQSGEMAPLPTARPKLVTPVAGQTNAEDGRRLAGTVSADDTSLPEPTGPASDADVRQPDDANAADLSPTTATALSNGVALPPLEAPEAVLDVIRAGNIIARTPYKWGGGHGRFQDDGYDCSGSVSYALYYAGLIDGPHVSGELMAYGEPGPGKWITIYANPGHVYMEVAGIRFDTSGASNTGSRWQNELYGNRGGAYEVRHPAGL